MSTDAKQKKGRLVSLGHGKTVLMPDIYAEEFSVEKSTLEVVKPRRSNAEESDGFDPYDTAKLYKK